MSDRNYVFHKINNKEFVHYTSGHKNRLKATVEYI